MSNGKYEFDIKGLESMDLGNNIVNVLTKVLI